MKNTFFLIILLLAFAETGTAQKLKPGFDKEEYRELMRMSARQANVSWDKIKIAPPERHRFVYRSAEIGLSNLWDLWVTEDQSAAIIIRGTTANLASWLANMYAAMVPAKGVLQLEKGFEFQYNLSDDPKAAVHTGWLVATAYLSRDMLPKIDSLYQTGTRDFLIMGHSQGGAISYLLTSYLTNLKNTGRIGSDITFKTYCSAAPKPGNLYYAYDYENLTHEGWAYNVVNTADWVPEMPVSIQTIRDYNNVNPFVNALPAINKQKFLQRILLRKAYKRLSKPPRKSQEDYQTYLGDRLFFFIRKQLPEFVKPKYFDSINYVRTGNTIVLVADEEYRKRFPDNQEKIFMHHFFEPYLFLLDRYHP